MLYDESGKRAVWTHGFAGDMDLTMYEDRPCPLRLQGASAETMKPHHEDVSHRLSCAEVYPRRDSQKMDLRHLEYHPT
eukprot:1377024-Amphidinium_carterae.1